MNVFCTNNLHKQMVEISTDNRWYKKKSFVLLAFCCVTLVMLITRYLSFYTFKGSDDLHYAFLSNHVLNGSYDMFFAEDIYAGRTIVVFYQALWFKLFGVNDLTMCMPSLSILILLAWLVCFKSGLQKDIHTVVLAASLVYFNPIVTRTTLGNLPDVYIALIALWAFLLVKKNTAFLSPKKNTLWGITAAMLLLAGLFVKENIVLIYAGMPVILFYYRKEVSRHFVIALSTTFVAGIAGYLFFYYINTGDWFYRFVQIKNAAYFNECSYQCLPASALLKRLTVTVPLTAVLTGAYPLLFLITVLFTGQNKNAAGRFWKISFLSLLLLALYFPFSILPYVPLCHDMRQFFFLFPFAAILFVNRFQEVMPDEKQMRTLRITGSYFFTLVVLLCVLFAPYNKWAVLCNCFLGLAFIFNVFQDNKKRQLFYYVMIPLGLWLSTAYPVYRKLHNGYGDLKAMQSKLKQQTNFSSNTYLFINNDTKTHFAFINKFDTAKRFLNFDMMQKGFRPFISYQPKTGFNDFQNGWLIISDAYPEDLDPVTIDAVKQLVAGKYFTVTISNTTAWYINSPATVEKIIQIINSHTAGGNCY